MSAKIRVTSVDRTYTETYYSVDCAGGCLRVLTSTNKQTLTASSRCPECTTYPCQGCDELFMKRQLRLSRDADPNSRDSYFYYCTPCWIARETNEIVEEIVEYGLVKQVAQALQEWLTEHGEVVVEGTDG